MEEKLCSGCSTTKPVSNFCKKKGTKDGFQSYCKQCNCNKTKAFYAKNSAYRKSIKESKNRQRRLVRMALNSIKSNSGCAICPENEACCLDFHHFEGKGDRFKKTRSINGSGVTSIPKLVEELEKCDVVCSNCHRKLTAGVVELSRKRVLDTTPLLKMVETAGLAPA